MFFLTLSPQFYWKLIAHSLCCLAEVLQSLQFNGTIRIRQNIEDNCNKKRHNIINFCEEYIKN